MTTYVNWKEFYSVGDDTIDPQHRQILRLINELYSAMAGEMEKKTIKNLVDQLVAYTQNHFEHEEKVMEEHGYPGLAEHKVLHYFMTEKTLELQRNFDALNGK